MKVIAKIVHLLGIQIGFTCLFPQIWEETTSFQVVIYLIIHSLSVIHCHDDILYVLEPFTMRVCMEHPIIFDINCVQFEEVFLLWKLEWEVEEAIKLGLCTINGSLNASSLGVDFIRVVLFIKKAMLFYQVFMKPLATRIVMFRSCLSQLVRNIKIIVWVLSKVKNLL